MCGIVGYVGPRQVVDVLVGTLKLLEYRGYDSCGVAVLENGTPKLVRTAGRIAALEEKLRGSGLQLNGRACGIGHTRWATHGYPNEVNAHPHLDCTGSILVVHNGIIENYLDLRRKLSTAGHQFCTETDTEVLPHLIESRFRGNLEEAVAAALQEVAGVYGMVAISKRDGMKIVAARHGAPLVVGIGQDEHFIASDAPALLPYTRSVVILNDGEMAIAKLDSLEIRDLQGRILSRQPQAIHWTAEMAEKRGYPHFMPKEIFEQPAAVRETISGRLEEDRVRLEPELGNPAIFSSFESLTILACGTSFHAGLIGKYVIEQLAGIPVDVDYASEFRYRKLLLDPKTLIIGISQSGETADTLGALQEARPFGSYLLSICNVMGSSIARLSDAVLYTHAGPEIGVASTKTFTAQVSVLYMLALFLARRRKRLDEFSMARCVQRLRQIPSQMERVLEESAQIEALAQRFQRIRNSLFLGRGINFPVALEGALKLKEISYVHAEGYAAGEMKHGPIALIDEETPTVVVVPRDAVYRKTMGNIEEVKVRKGEILAVATEGDEEIIEKSDYTSFIPETDPLLTPLLAILPLQLFAYYTGVLRGCDVDKPRNLAKSVTVE